MLVSSTGLVSLSLNYCIDDDDNVEWLVNVLVHFPRLTHLNLHNNHLGAARMDKVCGVLCHMPHITSLILGANSLANEVKRVCGCIRNMPKITALDLSYNIGADDVMHVCAALANKHHMTRLNLENNWMGSEGMRHLLSCLTQLPNLSYLCLRGNDVDGETKKEVRRLLSHVKGLSV
eukprot:c13133_g1_i2.p1 GENE.c13133_g1_i2~~c13133_g1_i2.p1  ORF type:complete len:177 (-),score=51.09 c13133_g1_i2:153-683(-)